ncbi:MAG TPA: response regulator [Terriglobales bacterium]|nr:response regulator [Terriglobales bacterium]
MLKLLLVDDEPAILEVFKEVLELSSFEVHTAKSASEALTILQDEVFDAVATDLRMESPLAGYQVVRAACNISPRPTIALVTAFPVPSSEWRQAGVDALFVKGHNTIRLGEDLLQLVNSRPSEFAPAQVQDNP